MVTSLPEILLGLFLGSAHPARGYSAEDKCREIRDVGRLDGKGMVGRKKEEVDQERRSHDSDKAGGSSSEPGAGHYGSKEEKQERIGEKALQK